MAKDPRGGPRGGGRPKGSKLMTKTRLLAEKYSLEGATPLEVILEGMRYFHALAELEARKIAGHELEKENIENFKLVVNLKQTAIGCAKDAAPYMHPKLANIEANVNISNVEAELAELE